MKEAADQTSRYIGCRRQGFSPGDQVWVKTIDHRKLRWVPGVVQEMKSASSCFVLSKNRVRHLSTSFLRQRYSPDPDADMEDLPAVTAPDVPVPSGVDEPLNALPPPSDTRMAAPLPSATLPSSPPIQDLAPTPEPSPLQVPEPTTPLSTPSRTVQPTPVASPSARASPIPSPTPPTQMVAQSHPERSTCGSTQTSTT